MYVLKEKRKRKGLWGSRKTNQLTKPPKRLEKRGVSFGGSYNMVRRMEWEWK